MINFPIKNKNLSLKLQPSKIICLGLNYLDHIKESLSAKASKTTKEIPKEPVLFAKTPNVLIGHEEKIVIPKFIEEPEVHYEAELAFIIKSKCKNVSKENEMEHILGFTCFNDVSERNIQLSDKSGWFRGKSFDTFGPIGPQLVLAEDIGDPQNLQIQCRLNGKTVQDSNTKFMIFKIPEILAFVSKNFTLEEGDIISTGTPSGVGPVKPGDVIEIEIENIGILRNYVQDNR